MKPQKNGPEKIAYNGLITQIVEQPMKIDGKEVMFERARRAPGVRLIIVKGDNILLSRDYRSELEEFDYRLPGGKVYDTLVEYTDALSAEVDMSEAAVKAAKIEAVEEVGIEVIEMNEIGVSHAGATVVWDLYYFVVTEFDELENQKLGEGEVIEKVWMTLLEAQNLAIEGKMKEDRSVGVLLRYLLKNT